MAGKLRFPAPVAPEGDRLRNPCGQRRTASDPAPELTHLGRSLRGASIPAKSTACAPPSLKVSPTHSPEEAIFYPRADAGKEPHRRVGCRRSGAPAPQDPGRPDWVSHLPIERSPQRHRETLPVSLSISPLARTIVTAPIVLLSLALGDRPLREASWPRRSLHCFMFASIGFSAFSKATLTASSSGRPGSTQGSFGFAFIVTTDVHTRVRNRKA